MHFAVVAAVALALVPKPATGYTITDGSRFAVASTGAQTYRVYDDVSGARYDLSVPATCSASVVENGLAGFVCDDIARVFDLRSRQWLETKGDPNHFDTASEFGFLPEAVGSQWVVGLASGYRWQKRYGWNWHTGEIRADVADTARSVPAPNAANPTGKLCSPFRQPAFAQPDDFEALPAFWPLIPYERPWGPVRSPSGKLDLVRCGGKRIRLQNGGASDATVGGGIVTWTSNSHSIRAYVIATGRRYAWTFPGPPNVPLTARHTINGIYVDRSGMGDWLIRGRLR